MKKNIDLADLVRPDLRDLKPYSSARDEFSTKEEMLFIDANENPFNSNLNRYPDPYQTDLKKAVAELKNIQTNQILLGNGSDEIIDLLVRLFCQPYQDHIMILPPTYGMYKVVAALNAVEVKTIDLNDDFQINTEKVLQSLTVNTKLLFICSPNNPTGNLMGHKDIFHLLEDFDGLVIVDEAYQDFSTEVSMLKYLSKYKNLIVMQTFSKAYGLAGARLGMCFADSQIIQYLNKIKPPYNVNALTQEVALEKIQNNYLVQIQIKEILKNRTTLENELKELKWVKKVYPSQANFLLVKVDDANARYNQLLEQKIVVRNRHNQAGCDNCLRFSIGTEQEIDYLLKTLSQLK
jgi:histidinol-phosphate aminotransferase